MQLDAEDDDQAFYKPAVEPAIQPSAPTDSESAALTTAEEED